MSCDVFVDANFCTFKLFNLGEAKNEEVCRNEENDQFERSKIVSILYLSHNPDISHRLLQQSKAKTLTVLLLGRKEKDRVKPQQKKKKDPSELKEREV